MRYKLKVAEYASFSEKTQLLLFLSNWGDWRESNPRPSGPQSDALTSWATIAILHPPYIAKSSTFSSDFSIFYLKPLPIDLVTLLYITLIQNQIKKQMDLNFTKKTLWFASLIGYIVSLWGFLFERDDSLLPIGIGIISIALPLLILLYLLPYKQKYKTLITGVFFLTSGLSIGILWYGIVDEQVFTLLLGVATVGTSSFALLALVINKLLSHYDGTIR